MKNITHHLIPSQLNVLDNHNGFTAIINGNTLWRNSNFLQKRDYFGLLIEVRENTFFQSNENDKIQGIYKVKGYKYPISLWFDKNGKRIA